LGGTQLTRPATLDDPSAASPTAGGRILVGVAIVLLAANLRVAVGSVGVVLESVRGDLGMSVTVGGILTTLPVLCFAVFGVGSAGAVRWFGLHRTAVLVLLLVTAGLVLRSLTHQAGVFLLCSVVCLAGAAIGNVILPPLVKVHFPDQVPRMSALYGAALMGGAALASVTTVPISNAFGGWRAGLGLWAILSAAAVVPWLALLRQDVQRPSTSDDRLSLRRLAHSRLAWAMLLLFASQSAGAYAQFGWFAEMLGDGGVSDGYAGTLLGVISAVGIPLALTLPWLMARVGDRPYLPWAFSVATIAGWLGVLLAPDRVSWLWAVLLGVGGGAFTWTLTMIARRSRTPAGTTALSVTTQGVGYLIAGLGPFGTGVLHDLSGGWSLPIVVLIGLASLIAVFGAAVSRSPSLEDTLS
jgi:MFS transporter, CP family, cyanate transporter